MPFEVTDNVTGKTLIFDNEPSEQDMLEAFGSMEPTDTPTDVGQPAQDPEELLFQSEIDNVPQDAQPEQDRIASLTAKTRPEPEQTFDKKIGQSFINRASTILDMGLGDSLKPENLLNPTALGDRAIAGAGQVAGFAGDVVGALSAPALGVVGNAVSTAYKDNVPREIQVGIENQVKGILASDAGQEGLNALRGGIDFYQDFKQRDPKTALELEGIINIVGFTGVKRIANPLIQEGKLVSRDVLGTGIAAWKKSMGGTARKIEGTIDTGLKGAFNIKLPTSSPLRKEATRKMNTAVEAIVSYKDKIGFADDFGGIENRLADTVEEFTQSIYQTKQLVYGEYSALAKNSKIEPDLDSIIASLDDVAGIRFNKTTGEMDIIPDAELSDLHLRLRRQNPMAIKEATRLAGEWRKQKAVGFDFSQAEKEVAGLNESLKAYYNSPNVDTLGIAGVQKMIANNLRKQMSDSIDGYPELKDTYGGLIMLEDVAAKAANRQFSAQHQSKLQDFSNVISSTAFMQGILSGNAALVVSAGAGKAAVAAAKKLKDPNRLVKNMLIDVENLQKKRATEGFDPQSATFGLGRGLLDRMKRVNKGPLEPVRALPPGQGFTTVGQPFTPKGPVQEQISSARTGQRQIEGAKPNFQTVGGVQDVPNFTMVDPRTQMPQKQIEGSARTQIGIDRPFTPQGSKGQAIFRGQNIDVKEIFTGDPFKDDKIAVALQTPNFLRTAEQKLLVDMVSRR